jgi:heat shock protein HtpX
VGFSNIFDTHPSVDARVAALVKFAGGRDPGPIALEPPAEPSQIEQPTPGPWSNDAGQTPPPSQGPWGSAPGEQGGKPFLPPIPPGPWGKPD